MDCKIVHIAGNDPSSIEPATAEVFAVAIDPKLGNTLVRELNQICPLENLRHVKRVKKTCTAGGKTELFVVLCCVPEHEKEERLPSDIQQLITKYRLSPYIASVAKRPALSKEEWEEQCLLWPTTFHPPSVPDGVNGLDEEETNSIFSFMMAAIGLSKPSNLDGKVVNAALIVDPMYKRVIASGRDENSSSLASIRKDTDQNGGSKRLKTTERYGSVSCLYPWSWTHQSSTDIYDNQLSWHPLRHAALVAVENAASRDKLLFPDSGTSKQPKIDVPEITLMGETSTNGSSFEANKPYLCTGLDIYLVWEPCPMCAMGLVHQRFRRIFFAFPNPNIGALGSVHVMQGERSLNHHYTVFRILLPESVLDE